MRVVLAMTRSKLCSWWLCSGRDHAVAAAAVLVVAIGMVMIKQGKFDGNRFD